MLMGMTPDITRVRRVLPTTAIAVLIVLPLLLTRLSCRCGPHADEFGIGDPVEHPPHDDDDADGDDSADDDGDDDNADDDSAAGDDDDDSASWPPDPCGTIYEPVNPDGGEDLEEAFVTDQGVGEESAPLRVRSGLFDDADTSLAVLWETGLDTTATEVQWGVADVAENHKVSATYVLGSEGSDQARLHEARICDLPPSSTIQYRVGTDGYWSDTFTYTTYDPGSESLSFIALGDSRGDPETLGSLFDMGMDHDPRVLLHTGDFVSSGGHVPYYKEFFGEVTPELASMTLLPVHGNHEGMAAVYFGMMAAPGGEEWYSVDFGHVHFAVFNSSCDETRLDTQAAWLEQDLAATTASFKIVACHHPMYSSGAHGSDEQVRDAIAPILDTYGVQLVFSGHDHGYERSVPLNGGVEVASPNDGTTYVTTAGGGAYLYTFTGDWFTEVVESVNHYCHIQVEARTLTFTAYRLDGTTLDSFIISLDE